ncbi:hypothetical protein EDC01DRAFT_628029 [Geopyxis carbonaria]|nr:hypothetical protein EDC01DRAFT_628029 [Geopyxis carbonaria]
MGRDEKKIYNARDRLQATGEGQRDDLDKWNSIKLQWLNKLCPQYEAIDDILRRDRSYTLFYVSESGGSSQVEIRNGELGSELPTSDLDPEPDDVDEVHPPAGGQKNPGSQSSAGKKAIKKERIGPAEKALDNFTSLRWQWSGKHCIMLVRETMRIGNSPKMTAHLLERRKLIDMN